MYSEVTLEALGTPFEIQPEVLAATERFDVDVYSDLYKDVYGVRPRMGLGDRTASQLDAIWDRLLAAHDEEMAAEERREAEAIFRWDDLVAENMNLGARDYATAVRWIMQASDEDDIEFLLWQHGVTSFENTSRVRGLANMER
jgi:hypothetical protein